MRGETGLCQGQEFGGFYSRAIGNLQVVAESLGRFQRVAFSNFELDRYGRTLNLIDTGVSDRSGGTYYRGYYCVCLLPRQ